MNYGMVTGRGSGWLIPSRNGIWGGLKSGSRVVLDGIWAGLGNRVLAQTRDGFCTGFLSRFHPVTQSAKFKTQNRTPHFFLLEPLAHTANLSHLSLLHNDQLKSDQTKAQFLPSQQPSPDTRDVFGRSH